MKEISKRTVITCPNCSTQMEVTEEDAQMGVSCKRCGIPFQVSMQFGNFLVERDLGEGSMGAVYLGRDVVNHGQVAIRLLNTESAGDEKLVRDFLQTAEIATSLHHPNIAPVFASGERAGHYYLVTEFMDGDTLEEKIEQLGQLSELEVLNIGIGVAQGLDCANKLGLIHRGLKPAEINFGSDNVPKVGDFGLSLLNSNGEHSGTPYYIAPEKVEGNPEDFRSDLYSLGATLFHALAGRPGYDGATRDEVTAKHLIGKGVSLKTFVPTVSEGTNNAIKKAMARYPRDRHASYEEFIKDLEEAKRRLLGKASGKTEPAPLPEGKKPVLPPRFLGKQVLIAFGLVFALLLVLATAVSISMKPAPVVGPTPSPAPTPQASPSPTPAPVVEAVQPPPLDAWQENRFGLSLHLGLYSAAGGEWKGRKAAGELFMAKFHIPLKDYGQLAKQLTLTKYDADQWVKAASSAGVKYLIISAKSAEGFALYDSPSSDFNIVKTSPYAQDPIIPLAAACKKYDLKLGFYYSLGRDMADPDVPSNKGFKSNTWDFPNDQSKVLDHYFQRKVLPQVKELLSQYGPVSELWFDKPELISKEESDDLKKLVNSLQSNCLISNGIGNNLGDFEVRQTDTIPWENMLTLNDSTSYDHFDTNFKSPEVVIRNLVDTVSKGGNFLLELGPQPDGELPSPALDTLSAIGKWMEVNGEAIYGTKAWRLPGEDNLDGGPQDKTPDIRFSAKGPTLYVFARSWKQHRVIVKSLALGDKTGKISNIELLGDKDPLIWTQSGDGLEITLPDQRPTDIPIYTFKVTF